MHPRQAEGVNKKHEGLMEMRFYVPDTEVRDEEGAEDAELQTTVDKLYDQVLPASRARVLS